MRSGLVVPVLAAAALVAAVVVARASTGPEPATPTARGSSLGGVACASSTSCLLVGSTGSVYGVQVPFAVESDGRQLTARPPVPPAEIGDAALAAVSCESPDSCLAVGRASLPTPFFGARSGGERPLAESWDGRSWRDEPLAPPPGTTDAGLAGVDCAAGGCMAVGDLAVRSGRDRPFAASWDGQAWAVHPPVVPRHADNTVLADVACDSPTSCIGVGHLEFDELVTGAAPLIERWNGSEWAQERSAAPRASTDTELAGVSCPAEGRCVAVGFQRRPDGIYAPFAELLEHGSWRALTTGDPAGSPDTELAGVACPATDRCLAVGSTVEGNSVVAFAESWDGTRWTFERPGAPAGSTSSTLTSVDCVPSAGCHAAGIAWRRSPIGHALTETWAGSDWTMLAVPDP
jgi:hypothetical protein